MADRPVQRVIATEAADLSEAVSFLPAEHPGPCAMSYRGRSGAAWAIFPTLREAETAAAFAVRFDIGGYSDVEVHPAEAAPSGTPTCYDARAWLGGDSAPKATSN